MSDAPLILIRAGAVRDAVNVNARPGAVAVRDGRILAAGEVTEVQRLVDKPDRVVDLPESLVLPAMVNAHAHLDLTDIEQTPYQGDFIGWVEMVMRQRPREDEAISRAVRRGLKMSKEAGVGYLGDIAGSTAAVWTRIHAEPQRSLAGMSWLECFGLGKDEPNADFKKRWTETFNDSLHASPDRSPVGLGLQPHAPYSAGLELYEYAVHFSFAASTHLAETPEELQFVRDAAGPLADLLRRLGKWSDHIAPTGLTPVTYLSRTLRFGGRWVLAHCNYVTDEDIAKLAMLIDCSVAYCPLAFDYFHHRNHRYRDMLAAGINVCIGTDSIICQPEHEPQPLGILPQIRHLYRCDKTDPQTLLKMATMNGAEALFLDNERKATLAPGQRANLIHVPIDITRDTDPLVQVLLNSYPATPIDLAQAENENRKEPRTK